jgi:histidinol-phosphate phosphatase family protein
LNKYVIFDRDGTLIEHVHHLVDPEKVKLRPHTGEGLQKLASSGYKFGVVTNQSVIERGMLTQNGVEAVNNRMINLLEKDRISFDFIYICPHLATNFCNCRKPKTALGEKAVRDFEIDISQSFMVGDQITDIEFGSNLGLSTILIGRIGTTSCKPDFQAKDILEASQQILSRSGNINEPC